MSNRAARSELGEFCGDDERTNGMGSWRPRLRRLNIRALTFASGETRLYSILACTPILGLYNLAYMFDDAVLISGLVVLLLGLLLVFRPEWLSFM
jgi:hypothetical protein